MLGLQDRHEGCALCGCKDTAVFVRARGTDIHRDQIFQTVICKRCGLVFLSPLIQKQHYRELATVEFYQKKYDIFQFFFAPYMDFLAMLRARKVRRFFKGPHTILDVGCGGGGFLAMMVNRGCTGYGLDISAQAIAIAKARGLENLWCRDILDAAFEDKRFDCITFWQSFEHMAEPDKVLQKARRILKDTGMIFISVPNVASFEARMDTRKWFGLDLPKHLYQYSPQTLAGMLEKNGFCIAARSLNSLEYNFPMFAQSFFNVLGGETNLLYALFKRMPSAGENFLLRLYTILLMVALMPLVITLTAALYLCNIVTGNGPVIEVFAQKKE